MHQPLVSIIMGVFNEEKTIKKSIESILNQTYTNWEFIICNDCSSDRTRIIIEEYLKIDNRIILINNNKNLRLAASLNKCLDIAKGKYIARMDADDESMPSRLEIQVEYLENHNEIDCVGCNRIIFDDFGDHGIRNEQENPTKDILLFKTPFAHPTVMMKKEVYDNLGGYIVSKETMRAEDLDLWFRFFEHGYKGYNIQLPLYRYHESENDLKKRSFRAAVGTAKIYYEGYKKLGFPLYKYPMAIKPIVSALLPNKIMMFYYKKMLKTNNC